MKSRSFKSYVQIRESEDLSPSDMDINTEPDATKMFDGEEKESESGLHTLMQLLWTKHRQAIEPVIQRAAKEDPEVDAAYDRIKNEPDTAVKAARRKGDQWDSNDNRVTIPDADSAGGQLEEN